MVVRWATGEGGYEITVIFGGCTTLYMLTLCHSMYTCIRPAPWEEGSSISIVPIIRTNTVPHYTRGGGGGTKFFIQGEKKNGFHPKGQIVHRRIPPFDSGHARACERERETVKNKHEILTQGPKRKKRDTYGNPLLSWISFSEFTGPKPCTSRCSLTQRYRCDSIDCSNEISRTVSIILVAYCARV